VRATTLALERPTPGDALVNRLHGHFRQVKQPIAIDRSYKVE